MTRPNDPVYPDIDNLLDHEIEDRLRSGLPWSDDKRRYARAVLDKRALKRAKDAQAGQTNAAWVAAGIAAISLLVAVATFLWTR
jgi:hypothetical protein